MKYILLPLFALLAPTAFPLPEVRAQNPERTIDIKEIEVVGKRPLKDIGVQQTHFDSTILKENIALSMADVLTFNSSIFVKTYGRATLSTVSFRGTSASHTQVTWNGMRINSPMLGMTDFSMIPSYFIDDASLLHGTSSVNETGGGLGGAVKLSTRPADAKGFGVQYIQGIGSFKTFDEFLRLTYGNDRWQVSTRAVFSSSANDFRYRNRDKKENIYDDDMNIVGQYHPVERNDHGSFKDFHLLQEAYFNTGRGDRFGLNAWYTASNRELASLTVNYGDPLDYENRQRENTFRGVLSWEHLRANWKLGAQAGYIHTWMAYDYDHDISSGNKASMVNARNTIHTFYGRVEGEYYIGRKWLFTANVALYQHLARNVDKEIITTDGRVDHVGYYRGRTELSGVISAKWKPVERFGVSVVLREESYGKDWSPPIPALFLDGVLSRRGNVVLKASGSRNFRFPTLNDLYFKPGGNESLKRENGWTYDAGLSFAVGREGVYSLSGSAAWFDSYIDDWILWLPNRHGYYSPVNIKDVHAYGVELTASLGVQLAREWHLSLDGTFSWTSSENVGEPFTSADMSVGKQLPYVPKFSATVNGRLTWRRWSLLYKWCYYSRRYTMTSNAQTLTGYLPEYFMSNLSLEKVFAWRHLDLSLKATVNNLFDEEYLSVLSRPMPGINFEFFVGIRPKWGCGKK